MKCTGQNCTNEAKFKLVKWRGSLVTGYYHCVRCKHLASTMKSHLAPVYEPLIEELSDPKRKDINDLSDTQIELGIAKHLILRGNKLITAKRRKKQWTISG